MATIGNGVSLRGLFIEDFQFPFLVSGGAAVDVNDAGEKAVMLDTAAANTCKLATDGATILGRLEVYEDREIEGIVLGTVSLFGGTKFIVNPDATDSPDETPAVGDYLVGAVSDASKGGYVRKATTVELALGTKAKWQVVEVGTDGAGNDYAVAISV